MSLIAALVMLGACGDSEALSEGKEKKETAATKTKGKLKEEDYEKLYSDPDKYKGYEIELTGKVFTKPEKDESGTYIQMWADPENAEKNTLVAIKDSNIKIATDDYVKITGTIEKAYEGENAFGGTVSAPVVNANSAEVVDFITATSPTLKEIEVKESVDQHGLAIELQKIELADNQTRVYVKVKNDSQENASFYSFNSKLIVGNKQLEEEMLFEADLPQVQSELLPGIETEGVIVFPAIAPDEEIIKFHAEGSTDDYELDFKPYTFEVSIK
ncbi:hypothetical protein X953_16265 [Virgibacillus sp. SK37]|nr:hypothetical protein X953_16265 [Virgibacillus sp. SK37]